MAFPTVESAAVTEFFSGPTTSHNVSMPATVDAGDLLLAVVFITGTSEITATGWTEIRTGTTANNNERLEVLAKVAVGNEGGTTVDFQTSSAAYAIVHLYRISGWYGDIAGIEASVMATGSGTGPNPPSLTVSWGSDDNLFIAVGAKSDGTVTGPPANFTNLLSGPTNENMGTARRAIASATQDPGSFSGSTSAQWVATTIGVRPAAAADPVPELTAALAVELNLAGDAATPPATIPEVSAALGVAVDLAGAAEAPAATVPEITSSLAIGVDLAGAAETPPAEVPELTASLNLAVDLAGDVAAPPATVPEITSSLAIDVDLAAAAETPPDIPELEASLHIDLALDGTLDVPPATVPELTGALAVEVAASGVLAPPAVEVPELAATLNLAVDLAGAAEAPAATVPEVTSELAVAVAMAGVAMDPVGRRYREVSLAASERTATVAATSREVKVE